ncbi:hypothetical protein TWF481_003145 [Arthrobotrys musiformis]|uniref:Uncharacterized protein n=1 Tax=Arthrobotrys musiformis TaxID=47236 RepID=A0AAV9VPD6_9PEZI
MTYSDSGTMYSEGATVCKFGPANLAIGIKAANGTVLCTYPVNRDVFIALAPEFEQGLDEHESILRREASEYFLPLDPSKEKLLKSFATFINEGVVVPPRYRGVSEPDNLLFLYHFADLIGCGLLKRTIVIHIIRYINGLKQQFHAPIGSKNGVIEAETMEWINAFYECTTDDEVAEFKMWRMVEAVLGYYPCVKMVELGLKVESHWDPKFKSQILENVRLQQQVGMALEHLDASEGGRAAHEETETETEAGDVSGQSSFGDSESEDFDMEEGDAPVEYILQGVRGMGLAFDGMEDY